MSSRRLKILQGLETQLKTVTLANGYNTDVAMVTRKVVLPDDARDTPRVQIIADTEDIEATTHEMNAALNVSEFNFRLMDYVKTSKDINEDGILSDAIENHIEDVKKCLYKKPTLGLSWITNFELTFVDSYAVWDEDKGIVIIDGLYQFMWQGETP